MTQVASDTAAPPDDRRLVQVGFRALTLGSIGVVYGDIGTSPLYAFREAVVAAADSGPITREIVLGVLSLILWALAVVVTAKYVLVLLRADNNGEGGTLSLTALASRALGRRTVPVFMMGIIGAAMFYGDSVITPAISVLSAVEGLKVAGPALEHYVLPLTGLILVVLFAVQSRGTARIASFFGPVMAVWFLVIGAAGLAHVGDNPSVLAALDPTHGVRFLYHHGHIGLVTLGFVFLAVTGGEALYADLGHFGRRPIQTAWFGLVLPALVINYFGQGALVLTDPGAIENPFYRLVPAPLLPALIVLATAATVIASQAVITGAYSLTRQAVALGLLPRLEIRHTSEAHSGQIYVPRVNVALLIGVLLLVGLFRTSSAVPSETANSFAINTLRRTAKNRNRRTANRTVAASSWSIRPARLPGARRPSPARRAARKASTSDSSKMTSSMPVSFVMLSDISLRPCFKSRVDAEFEPRPDFPDLWSESPPRPCFEFRTATKFDFNFWPPPVAFGTRLISIMRRSPFGAPHPAGAAALHGYAPTRWRCPATSDPAAPLNEHRIP